MTKLFSIILIICVLGGGVYFSKKYVQQDVSEGEPIASINNTVVPEKECVYYENGVTWKGPCTPDKATTTKATSYKLTIKYVLGSKGYTTGYMGKITPSTGGRYTAGTTAVLKAEPVKGFMVQWDGPCASQSNTCKVLMNSDKTVNIYFKQKPNWKCNLSLGYFGCTKEW